METNTPDPAENTQPNKTPQASTENTDRNASLPDANEKPGPFEELAQSEMGAELYDYGDGGGPDASSSGLRDNADRTEDSTEEDTH